MTAFREILVLFRRGFHQISGFFGTLCPIVTVSWKPIFSSATDAAGRYSQAGRPGTAGGNREVAPHQRENVMFMSKLKQCALAVVCFAPLLVHATPQTGWWWNPAEGGRGFAIEIAPREATRLKTVGDLMGLIERKQQPAG